MSLNISGLVKRMLPTLSKSDLETDLDVSLDALSTALTAYQDLKEAYSAGKFKSAGAQELVNQWYKEFKHEKAGLKLSTVKNFPVDMVTVLTNMTENAKIIKTEVEDISNEVIVSKALTIYKGNVLRAVEHYFFMTRYALDLLNYLYTLEAINGGVDLHKEAMPNAKQIEFVTKNMWIFARMTSVYGQDPARFKGILGNLSHAAIATVDEAYSNYKAEKVDIFDDLPSGFIGSPVYTVRLIYAQWEADRYKQLKDKKKLLELRSLHLKLIQEQGGGDVNTERELAYLQKRITDIDYKVAKIEASVEGN